MRKVSLVLTMAAAAVALASSPAQASSVLCPEFTQQPGDRQFQITVSPNAYCRVTGSGNLNGNNDAVNNYLFTNFWTTLDKSDDNTFNPETAFAITGDGELSGTFSFSSEVWSHWGRVIVGFKSGGQGTNWAAFELTNGQSNGDWAILGDSQTLGHAILYGADPGDYGAQQVPVPEPASLALLGLGLVVAVRQLRRKK